MLQHIEKDLTQVRTSNTVADVKSGLFENKCFTRMKYPSGFSIFNLCYSDKTDIILKEKPVQKLSSHSVGTWMTDSVHERAAYETLNLLVTTDHEVAYDRRAYGRRTVRGRKLLFRYIVNSLKRNLPSLFRKNLF